MCVCVCAAASITQIIELLISESYDHINDPQVFAHTFCLEARALVNDDYDTLGAAIEAKSVQCARSSWANGSEAGQAARMLTDVAIKCVKGATGRSTPAQVLAELEATERLAGAGRR